LFTQLNKNKSYLCGSCFLFMKYTQHIGVLASLLVIGICFLPWVEVPSLHLVLNGLNAKINENLSFGNQWKGHAFFAIIMIFLFLIQKIWAKRSNIFFGVLHLGWAIKNYLIFSMCRQGECPEIKPALYLLVLLSIIMLIMTFLPPIEIKSTSE